LATQSKADKYWEQYVVKRPGIIYHDGTGFKDKIWDKKPVPRWSAIDTGPQVAIAPMYMPSAKAMVEYGIICGDCTQGLKGDPLRIRPHFHDDYEEMFIFMGTNGDDVADLGGEVTFWVGEGDTLKGVVFKEPGAIIIPKGTMHFPQVFTNVKRPITEVVIMLGASRRIAKVPTNADGSLDTRRYKGRPSWD
jgi:hypothetical protein